MSESLPSDEYVLHKYTNDHDKFLIIQYLVLNTLNFLSNNLVKLDFDTYYSKNQMEIADFNIMNISRDLYISKETAIRKILQLEKIGAIVRDKKKNNFK